MVARSGLGHASAAPGLRPAPFEPASRALVVALGIQPGEIPGLIAAAARLTGEIDVIDDGTAPEALLLGATRRLHCEVAPADLAALAAWIADLARSYRSVITAADSHGKDWLPRAAALDGAQPFSEVIALIDANTLRRAIYAGDVIETVRSDQPRLWMTVRAAAFAPLAGHPPVRSPLPAPAEASASRQRILARQTQGSLSLKDARALVAGGRALASAEQFMALLQPLAERLNGGLAASRAAVDAGYAPNSWQVGQTGQSVSPEVYVAVGISGAAQHVAGMRDSKLIVAINTDQDAPMMQLADIAWQADLFTAVPALCEALDAYCSRKTGL
ncbi:FAD-binding protein [Jeongeupia naejangsanensis]|uniref:electron transfer flavoprotein subunit alpha/FixB family protein n=1 Tax=Jeongeupia naejangsanensis TaxID=613195 RepID=UPI001EEFE4CE